MSRTRLPIVLHLSPEQIYRGYRACRSGVEKTHWQLLWLLTRPEQPLAPAQAAAQVGLTAVWARAILKRWNAEGPGAWPTAASPPTAAKASSRPTSRSTCGPPSSDRPPTAGSGPGPRSPPSSATAGAYGSASRPARNGCTAWASRSRCRAPATPRPPPRPSNRPGKEVTARWIAELRRQNPGQQVEFWAEDEARLGLKPVARRVWAVRGRRPSASGRTKYQWLYVYGLVHPASGRNLELLLPSADADWMGLALGEFARWADPEGRKLLVVLVDNAGWHVARRLVVPANVVLRRLPPCTPELQPCTPELQPAEPLWPLVREAVANEGFDDLGGL